MAKNAVTEYDSDPANNTDIGGTGIEGDDSVQNFDNGLRILMSHLADLFNGNADFTVTSTDATAASGPDITLFRNSATPADSDLLGKIEWKGKNDAGTTKTVSQLYVQMTDVSDTTEDAALVISTISGGATTTVATFGGGVLKAANAVQVDQATGWLIKLVGEDTGLRRDPLGAVTELWANGNLVGQFAPSSAELPGSLEIGGNIFGLDGTYTPTATGVANVTASTPSVAMYYQIGSVVTVAGKVAITATATGNLELGLSLPVASNFTADEDAAGTFKTTISGAMSGGSGAVYADAANNRVTLQFNAATTISVPYLYQFSYRIKV